MKLAFTVITDKRFLPLTCALWSSLRAVNSRHQLFIFCMDRVSYQTFEDLGLEGVTPVPYSSFATTSLMEAQTRMRISELCWSAKPLSIQYVLQHAPEFDWVAYLDADMCFFSDPSEIFSQQESDVSGLLTPHAFSDFFKPLEKKVGHHNAGFVAFRQHPDAQEALTLWFKACLARPSLEMRHGETFDQKILGQLQNKFPSIIDINHRGFNAAPWNIQGHLVTLQDDDIRIGADLLVLYHYQGMRFGPHGLVELYGAKWHMKPLIRRKIYKPIIHHLSIAFGLTSTSHHKLCFPVRPLFHSYLEICKWLVKLAFRQRFISRIRPYDGQAL